MTIMNRFDTPMVFGWGVLDSIEEFVPKGKTMIITGRSSSKGYVERIRDRLGKDIRTFPGVEPNPGTSTVEKGANAIRGEKPDILLAVGGGSVIDAAKFMAVIAAHGGGVLDYLEGRMILPDRGFPLYAVPTTPGTSSEITPFTVVTVKEHRNKVALRHPALYPRCAIIDPELTVSLPKEQTAATGFDILSHAVESYWSRRSTALTRELALRSVSLVSEHLKGAYDDGLSRQHREGISLASVLAGMSFSNAGTTICHSISYPVTFDSGLHHGIAVALTLGSAFRLLKEKGFKDLGPLASALGTDIDGFGGRIEDMLRSVDAPVTLRSAGYAGSIDRIVATDMSSLMGNFPVEVTKEELRSMISTIY